MFESVRFGPPDPMYDLKVSADADTSPGKADLGVGIYRGEEGEYSELRCVNQAKKHLIKHDPGHDYEVTTGNVRFLKHAASVMFGSGYAESSAKKIASVQTISGTGAVHIAAQLIATSLHPRPSIYVGTPTWGNYKPMCELAGLEVIHYQYYDSERRTVDFHSVLKAAREAPAQSIFILQGCCHNPTGADLTKEQWNVLALLFQEKQHVPLLDVAYQGLGHGLDQDAYAVRMFVQMGFEAFVCQSFSKNFALYGERCGALHVVCKDNATSRSVFDRLRCLIRWEFSSAPAFGSRLVSITLEAENLTQEWTVELDEMRSRLKQLRQQLHTLLTERLKTPGEWNQIITETGLFSYLPLSPTHCQLLRNKHHVYLPDTGRINVSGLNRKNIERVATSIDQVIRFYDKGVASENGAELLEGKL